MQNILFLGSRSVARKKLLEEAQIPFAIIDQSADEQACDWNVPLQELVSSIAEHKMKHILLPLVPEKQQIFVLTADTLTQTIDGAILGKPQSLDQAYQMLRAVRKGAVIATAFCLQKMIRRSEEWHIQDHFQQVVQAECTFDVPDTMLVPYCNKVDVLSLSGAASIDGYGAQFLKSVVGSYTTILGLPLYEVRTALENLHFFG